MKPQYRAQSALDGPRAVENQLRTILGQFGDADVSTLIGPFAIATSETRIPHGRDGTPLGWSVVSPDALATVCQTKASDSTYIYLKASVAVNAKVRVF